MCCSYPFHVSSIGKHRIKSILLPQALRCQIDIVIEEKFVRSVSCVLLSCDASKLKPRSVELKDANTFYGLYNILTVEIYPALIHIHIIYI